MVSDASWIKVHADQEYVLSIDLRRLSKLRQERKAIAPKFPKQKEEGWFLVLGSKETRELIAMKRVPYIYRRATHQVSNFVFKQLDFQFYPWHETSLFSKNTSIISYIYLYQCSSASFTLQHTQAKAKIINFS